MSQYDKLDIFGWNGSDRDRTFCQFNKLQRCTAMHRYLQACILCLGGLLVASEDNETSGFAWSGENNVCVENIFSPIWRTSFEQRTEFACGINNFGNLSKREPEYSQLFCTSETPWDRIPEDSNYLAMFCRPEYKAPHFATDIEQGVLGRYKNLLNMKLERCHLRSLTQKTFMGLSRLMVIWITSNFIHTVTEGAFDGFTNLKWLRFADNSLVNQSHISINNCNHQKLEFLELYTNNVTEVKIVNNRTDKCSGLKLSSLVLRDNPLHMKENMFEVYQINGILTVTKCHIANLEASYFFGLGNLQVIDLGYNHISDLPRGVFSSMSNLTRITLNNNRLTHLDVDGSFAKLPLQSLTLQENNISEIKGSFSSMPSLTELGLANNALTHITKRQFGNMPNLLTLYLCINYIESIEHHTFGDHTNLKVLDLSRNRLARVNKLYTKQLQHLKLHANNLKHFNGSVVEGLSHVQSIEIQRNKIVGEVNINLHACEFQYFDMSSNNIVSVNITIHSSNASKCSDESRFTLDAGNNHISSINVVFEGAEKKLYFNDNKVKSFNQILPLDDVKILNLRRNMLEEVPCDLKLSSPNMTLLDLGENQIKHVCSEGLKAIKKLHYLYLDKNKLVTFSPVDTYVLYLSDNPLGCTCENEPLKNWLLSNTAPPLTDEITCVSGLEATAILTSSITENCGHGGLPVKIIIIAVLSTILPVLVISMFALKFKYEIQVIAFYKWNVRIGLRCCKPPLQQHAVYTYDAFVCFAEEDVEYVRHVLVPLLEPKYKLCIYHRDFPVGVDIADAILNVIEDSALTVVVLSRHFMRSRWGKYEFKQAHYNSMRHEHQKLLIIVIDEAVLRQKVDLTLRSILFAKAYLKNDDTLFTQKLLYAMPDREQQDVQAVGDGAPLLVHVE